MSELSPYVLSNSHPPLVGRVVSENEVSLQIEWADGRTNSFNLGAHAVRRVKSGTVAEIYASDPVSFASSFELDPVRLFVAALSEGSEDERVPDFRARLLALGLDPTVVRDAWKATKPRFDKHPHVMRGAAKGTYRWSPTAIDPLGWIDRIDRTEVLKRLVGKPKPAERHRLEHRLATLGMQDARPDELAAAWTLGVLPEPPTLDSRSMTDLSEPALVAFLAKLPVPIGQQVVHSVVDVRRPSRAADSVLSALGEVERRSLLAELGQQWLVRARSPIEDDRRQALGGLHHVLVRFAEIGVGQLDAAVGASLLGVRLALDRRRKDEAMVLESLDAMLTPSRLDQTVLRQLLLGEEGVEAVSSLSADGFDRKGTRVRVLTGLRGTDNEQLLYQPATWMNLGLPDLEDLVGSNHTLASYLLDGSSPIAAGIISLWLEGSEPTSNVIGRVLGWKSRMRDLVPAGTFQQKLRRARGSDPSLMRLLRDEEHMANQARIEALESAHFVEIQELRTQEATRAANARRLEERLEWAESQIRDTHDQDKSAYGAQLRQAQIDSVRALCSVLDEVFTVAGSGVESDFAVWAAAAAVAELGGVRPIGQAGAVVAIDPVEHELVGDATGPNAVVRRPGYEWTSGGERVVIKRAIVS